MLRLLHLQCVFAATPLNSAFLVCDKCAEFEKLRGAMEMNLDPEDKGKIMRLFAGTLGRRNLGDVPGARRTIMLRQLDRKRKQNEKVNTNEVIAKPAPNAPTKRPRVVTETHENVCTRRSQRRKVAKA